jgi:hypothetical protein
MAMGYPCPRFPLKNAGKSSPGRVYVSISFGSTKKEPTFEPARAPYFVQKLSYRFLLCYVFQGSTRESGSKHCLSEHNAKLCTN